MAELRQPITQPAEHSAQVRIDDISSADSPRLSGVNRDHVRMLAEIGEELPPIILHEATMRVVDGVHRLEAARLNGRTHIAAVFLRGTREEAFRVAVSSNVKHGLPLTLTERRAAAKCIIDSHPGLSDRAIAADSGLSPRTVAGIRKQTAGGATSIRTGIDGRVRPISATEGRRIASEMIVDRPQYSLRRIARDAGISVGTARDVRDKIRSGADPLASARAARQQARADVERQVGLLADMSAAKAVLDGLWHDPTVRYTERGKALVRWLSGRLITVCEYQDLIDGVPPYSAKALATLARECASVWAEFAKELDSRGSECA